VIVAQAPARHGGGMPSTPRPLTSLTDPVVTVVRTPACHLCEDALDTLTRLRERTGLRVRILEAWSAEGARLVAEHRAAMSPLVLLDGNFVSSGRLRTGHLLDLLRHRGVDVPLTAVR
jgi:hypothetical protein